MSNESPLFNLKDSFSKIDELQNLIKVQRSQAHSCKQIK